MQHIKHTVGNYCLHSYVVKLERGGGQFNSQKLKIALRKKKQYVKLFHAFEAPLFYIYHHHECSKPNI